MAEVSMSASDVFGGLREYAPELETLKSTVKWRTSNFTPSLRAPDMLQTLQLPGVSPFARTVAEGDIAAAGQIPIKELGEWYTEQDPEGMKCTENEWKAANTFTQGMASERRSSSNKARSFAQRNRGRIHAHLGVKKMEVKDKFARRVEEVKSARVALTNCLNECEMEYNDLSQKLKDTEEIASTKFEWPLIVNEACVSFREKRIGIDRVLDKVEIELLKEADLLKRVGAEQFEDPLFETKDCLKQLEQCMMMLAEDVKRKAGAEAIDLRLSRLASSKLLQMKLDEIQTRPPQAIDIGQWRESSEKLIQHTYEMMKLSKQCKRTLKKVSVHALKVLQEQQDAGARQMGKALKRAELARDQVSALLGDVKREALTTEREAGRLEKLIAQQETPLKLVTTQLAERAMRPDGEQTTDDVHASLIEEVADLDNAVSALTAELNINMQNLDELRHLEGVLEEDFAIKKNTLLLETRCGKARSYLTSDTDPYMIKKMMGDPNFFDVMTR